MFRVVRNVLVLGILVAAAVATWYWGGAPEPSPVAGSTDVGPSGYYLRDAVIFETGDGGDLLYRIHAELAEERPEDGTVVLNGVRIEYRAEEQIPWRVSAARAEISRDDRALELVGDVELSRDASDAGPAAVVRTERLVLEPERYVATATGDVSLRVGTESLAAGGLKAFLKEDRLELESGGHGRFQP